jgi:hypothetical protein
MTACAMVAVIFPFTENELVPLRMRRIVRIGSGRVSVTNEAGRCCPQVPFRGKIPAQNSEVALLFWDRMHARQAIFVRDVGGKIAAAHGEPNLISSRNQ